MQTPLELSQVGRNLWAFFALYTGAIYSMTMRRPFPILGSKWTLKWVEQPLCPGESKPSY
ncbi:hypothetical protein BJY04DRAFT_200510 [Aspergillus karnatakaensis]|uniref:uncharacterized protein n=1 Tax=Aspergillus karnatakaensis TaxID=1810916 RepID=UPI003CCE3AC9